MLLWLLVPVFALLALIANLFSKPIVRTPSEVADIIERFANNVGDDEWDDFVCIPIKDPKLDEIRERCAGIHEEFPPGESDSYTNSDGLQLLNEFVQQLRGGLTGR